MHQNSFLNETVKNLETGLQKYKNDNNLKAFSQEIKTHFGNIFNESQIKSLADNAS